jgi:hypothetical protein
MGSGFGREEEVVEGGGGGHGERGRPAVGGWFGLSPWGSATADAEWRRRRRG